MGSLIDRALIIRRPLVPLSHQYAEQCIDSCDLYGLPYEIVDGVEFLSCEQAFESVGVKKDPSYNNTMGNCCCHSSMIKCWRRIIELNKTCIILEHDALIVGDVTTLEIPDMAVVTFGFRVRRKDQYQPIHNDTKLVPLSRSVGCHAYAITPTTAAWLIEQAEVEGVKVGVDRYLMMERQSGLDLFACEPPQAVCWSRKSTSLLTEQELAEGREGHNSSPANFEVTEGWKRGLR